MKYEYLTEAELRRRLDDSESAVLKLAHVITKKNLEIDLFKSKSIENQDKIIKDLQDKVDEYAKLYGN